MRYLDRSTVPVPSCLAEAPQGLTYDDLYGNQKAEIRAALLQLQGHRCAYCERRTGDHQKYDGHIEHFRDQTRHDELGLCWENLYWSCVDERTCGKHKDKCRKESGPQRRYHPGELLDPGRDQPDDYLLFVLDGSVTARPTADERARARAEETIRVFRLNESSYLEKARKDAVQPYVGIVQTLIQTAPALLPGYVRGALQQASSAPFQAAIKHFLLSVVS